MRITDIERLEVEDEIARIKYVRDGLDAKISEIKERIIKEVSEKRQSSGGGVSWREYRTIQNVVGPLLLLENVTGAKNDELVEITLPSGERRRGKVIELENDTALVQVFEGTAD